MKAHTLTRSHAHTLTCSHAHTLTRSHTHTLTLVYSRLLLTLLIKGQTPLTPLTPLTSLTPLSVSSVLCCASILCVHLVRLSWFVSSVLCCASISCVSCVHLVHLLRPSRPSPASILCVPPNAPISCVCACLCCSYNPPLRLHSFTPLNMLNVLTPLSVSSCSYNPLSNSNVPSIPII